MTVTIRYVDGSTVTAPVDEWPMLCRQGVDVVTIADPSGSVQFSGASLYWLYRDGSDVVAGLGSVRYQNSLMEIVFDGLGGQQERMLDYMPDINHEDVKLGHWWPGTCRLQ